MRRAAVCRTAGCVPPPRSRELPVQQNYPESPRTNRDSHQRNVRIRICRRSRETLARLGCTRSRRARASLSSRRKRARRRSRSLSRVPSYSTSLSGSAVGAGFSFACASLGGCSAVWRAGAAWRRRPAGRIESDIGVTSDVPVHLAPEQRFFATPRRRPLRGAPLLSGACGPMSSTTRWWRTS